MRIDISGSYLYVYTSPRPPHHPEDYTLPREEYRTKKVFPLHHLVCVEVHATKRCIVLHFSGLSFFLKLDFVNQESYQQGIQILNQGFLNLGIDPNYL